MVAARTTADLLTAVEAAALLPPAEDRLSDAEILAMADEVIDTTVSEVLVGARAGWYVEQADDVSITSGTSLYAVPERAVAAGLSDVLIVNSDGVQWSAPELGIAEAQMFRRQRGEWDSPYAYTWRDDAIELLPTPTETRHSLRLLYPREPSRLVTVASCAVVSSTTSTTITTSDTVPSAWGSSETLDIVSPVTGRHRGVDQAGTSISGTSITISAGVPSGTAALDYVCLAGETCVPPIPKAVWRLLVAETTLEVLEAIGDPHRLIATTIEKRNRAEMKARDLLAPRNRGASRRIVDRHSPGRRGMR